LEVALKRAARSWLASLALPAAGVLCATANAAPTATPPQLRLPQGARPLRQSLDLTLDPTKEAFSGSTDIEIVLEAPTSRLWLNATELQIRSAQVEAQGRRATATVVPGGADFVGLDFGGPVGPGAASLHLAYGGAVSRRDEDGVFVKTEGDAAYLFTQFEPIGARRAFPGFDEPSFKIPWRVTLRVPPELVALGNAPEVSTGTEGGLKVVRFAETKPLPSYLVAVAVGPFDLVDGGPVGRKGLPFRIAVPRGRAADVGWAKESTPRLLALLEDYFDRPYPYEKLDQVAIPGAGFAMEHPGLVTYGQGIILQRKGEETLSIRRGYASVCAHELAHMWFGDLVTMGYWEDTWLNESFASWLGEKVTGRFAPDWGIEIERVEERVSALAADSLASARKLRQPIASNDDIQSAFDDITYGKGRAVLEMFEAWLGEETFRKGVQRYIDAHAWKNAGAADFLSALSAAAGRDVSAPFSTFMDQTGAPLVRAHAACEGSPVIVAAQEPYRRLGSPDPGPRTWQVPLCVKTAADPSCTLLASVEARLATAGTCPPWLFPNAGALGYFLSALRREDLERVLVPGRLTVAERVGLLGDLQALLASGDASAADALAVAAKTANDPSRHVVSASLRLVGSVDDLVPEALRPRYAAFVRDLFGARSRALGLSAAAGEDEETRLLRPLVLSAAGLLGDDPELGRLAGERARQWLEGGKAVDPELAGVVLSLAVRHGDRALFERLQAEALATRDRARRDEILAALGAVRDPEWLGQGLRLLLSDQLDPGEAYRVTSLAGAQPRSRVLVLTFVKENFDALAKRLPRDAVARLPFLGVHSCDEHARADLASFFGPRTASFPGGTPYLGQAVERVDQCIALAKAQGASLAAFLESRGDDGLKAPPPRRGDRD